MVSSDYAFQHVELAWAMIRGDSAALDRMDITADGFWRSFMAIPFSLPALVFIWAMGSHSSNHPGVLFSPVVRFFVDAALDVGIWLALAAIMILVLRALSMEARTAHFIIARNWTTMLFNYVLALAFVPGMLFGMENAIHGFVVLVVFIAMISAFIRVTRVALQINVFAAAALVIAEVTAVLTVSALVYPAV